MKSVYLEDEAATWRLAAALAGVLRGIEASQVIWLCGDLGAGKTSFARGLLRGLGYTGAVVSPSYTLMEPYSVADRVLLHLDLYRIVDAEELEYLGVRDAFGPRDWMLVEWPEQGGQASPAPDITLCLAVRGTGRQLTAKGHHTAAEKLLETLFGEEIY